MKAGNILLTLLLLSVLIAPAMAASITGCEVTGTNVYAGSSAYNIGPSAEIDSTSSATGITNVADRYLYASGIAGTVTNTTAEFSIYDRQGAAVNISDSAAVSGILWDYGDGQTGTETEHTYEEAGIYDVTLTLSSYLGTTLSYDTRVQVGATTISASISPADIATGGRWTLSAETVSADRVEWQVKTPGSTTWQTVTGTTYTPASYGTYQFRAIAYGLSTQAVSETLTGNYAAGIQDCVVENTNIYAGSARYDIGPSGSFIGSSATGISNIADRYVYAETLTAVTDGPAAVYTISGQQGSTATPAADGIGTTLGYLWDYGDGTTSTTESLRHVYTAAGDYITSLVLGNYLDADAVTLTANLVVYGPVLNSFEVDRTVGGIGSAYNFTINADAYTNIEWQLSRQDSGGWGTISEGLSTTYSLVPDAAGHWHVRAKIFNSTTGFTVISDPITLTIYAKPATGNIQVSPGYGQLNTQVQLSAGVEDPGSAIQATTYQWQISSGGNWSDIAGATSKISTVTLDLDAAGTYYFRIVATGIGGTAYSGAAEYRAYAAPEFSSVTVSPEKGGAPLRVLLSAQASDASGFRWEYSTGGGVWMQVAKSAAAYYTLTADGTYYFRAVATGFGGTTYSESLTVEVGDVPDASISAPAYSGMWYETGSSVSFSAVDAGSGVSYSWTFGDGSSASGQSVSHVFSTPGKYEVTLTTSNYFGSDSARIVVVISDATGDVSLMVSDVSPTGAELTGSVTVSPVESGTEMWFEIQSMSGQVVWKSPRTIYAGAQTYEAKGMPLISGQVYQAVAYTDNYGYSLPQVFVLLDAVQDPHEELGTAWSDGLNREPFNISALVGAGVGVFGGALGGGSVGSAVAFGVIAMFVLVGLWLRQQDVVIPLTLTLVAGWFVIGNLPGDWQPIAYSLMVVAVVAVFFYLFRKRVE